MVQKIVMGGRAAWLKHYGRQPRSRRAAARVWNVIVGGLDAAPLRSPPQHSHDQAKRLELRRLGQLRARGVLVPRVLGEGRDTLLLSDIGPSLSRRLRDAPAPRQVDELVHGAVAAIVSAHRRGAYLGQAFARNIVVADGRVGFIDFEEDPLEIMPLRDAQARDWLMFTAGVSRHYEGRSEVLAGMIGEALPNVADGVAREVRQVADRLGFLHRCTRHLGRRARALGVAVVSLRNAFGALLFGLLTDIVSDGDCDVFDAMMSVL